MARTQAVYYRASNGTESVDEFIQALPPKRAAKIDDFVEEYLNDQAPEAPPPPFPITSQIEGELRELRIRFRQHPVPHPVPALGEPGGAASRAGEGHRSGPGGDIELATQRMADFKRRMDATRRTPPRAAGKDAPPVTRPQ